MLAKPSKTRIQTRGQRGRYISSSDIISIKSSECSILYNKTINRQNQTAIIRIKIDTSMKIYFDVYYK